MSVITGLQITAPRQLRHMIGGPVGQSLDGSRGLLPAGSNEAAPIHQKQVRQVMTPVEAVDDRVARIVAHAASAHEMGGGTRRFSNCPGTHRVMTCQRFI